MDSKLKEKWLDALDKNKRARHVMKRTDENGDCSYCCLGVLRNVLIEENMIDAQNTRSYYDMPEESEYLSENIIDVWQRNIYLTDREVKLIDFDTPSGVFKIDKEDYKTYLNSKGNEHGAGENKTNLAWINDCIQEGDGFETVKYFIEKYF